MYLLGIHFDRFVSILYFCHLCTRLLHGHIGHGLLYLSCACKPLCVLLMGLPFCNIVCTCTPVNVVHTITIDMWVQSDSIVSPSLHVQWGNTPLLTTAQEGHAEIAHFLLENGSSVQEQNNVGWPKGVMSSCKHLMLFPEVYAAVICSSSNQA